MSEKTETSLMSLEPTTISTVFKVKDGVDPYIKSIENAAMDLAKDADISTAKGRKQVISAASTVIRTKTTGDKLAKALKDNIIKEASSIDPNRKKWRDDLDGIAEKIRKPVTDWENKEKNRVANLQEALKKIVDAGQILVPYSDEEIANDINYLENVAIDDSWDEYQQSANTAKESSLINLVVESNRRAEQKAKDDELEVLRAAQAERESKDEAERIEKERITNEAKQLELDAIEEKEKLEASLNARKFQIKNFVPVQDQYGNPKTAAQMGIDLNGLINMGVPEYLIDYAEELQECQSDAVKHAQELIFSRQEVEAGEAEAKRVESEAEASRIADEAAQAERDRLQGIQDKEDAARVKREANKKHKLKISDDIRIFLMEQWSSCINDDEKMAVTIGLLCNGQVPHTVVNF